MESFSGADGSVLVDEGLNVYTDRVACAHVLKLTGSSKNNPPSL